MSGLRVVRGEGGADGEVEEDEICDNFLNYYYIDIHFVGTLICYIPASKWLIERGSFRPSKIIGYTSFIPWQLSVPFLQTHTEDLAPLLLPPRFLPLPPPLIQTDHYQHPIVLCYAPEALS